MDHPDTPALAPTSTTTPPTPAGATPGDGSLAVDVSVWIRATHQLRRAHDGSVISTHCSVDCGAGALAELTLAQLIGPNSPGPLEQVRGELVDLATGEAVGFSTGITPLNGEPTDVYSWP